jgi:site-specific recombinase XerD
LITKHLYRQPDGTVEAPAFTSTTGQPLRHSNFYSRTWKPAVHEAGLPTGLRIHDLRHTAAAFLIDEGAHLELVRQQLGHSSISVTQKYAHLYPSATEDLAARLDDRYRQLQQQPVGLVWG